MFEKPTKEKKTKGYPLQLKRVEEVQVRRKRCKRNPQKRRRKCRVTLNRVAVKKGGRNASFKMHARASKLHEKPCHVHLQLRSSNANSPR